MSSSGIFDTVNSVAAASLGVVATPIIAARQAAKYASQKSEEGYNQLKSLLPSAPALPSLPPTAAVAQARNMQAAQQKRYGGTGSTILTGALGVPGGAVTQKKTLLGQ